MEHASIDRNMNAFLPSPAPSATAGTSTVQIWDLPQARSHPLKPGSQKEIALIDHVDARILHINRRYAKKFSTEQGENDQASGYEDFKEVSRDLDAVFSIVWISGTPALQVPYLLSLAGLLSSYVPAFPFTPASTFRLVKKLDAAFVYLLQHHSDQIILPHPTCGYHVSMTDRVRIKSLVEATRMAAVEAAEKSGYSQWADESTDDGDKDEQNSPAGSAHEEVDRERHGKVAMGLAQMYERTLELLGDWLS